MTGATPVREPGMVVGLAVTLGLAGCFIGENPYWDPHATTSGSGSGTGNATGNTTGPTTSEATASGGTSLPTSTAGSTELDATTGPPGTLGQPCTDDESCDAGQSCCESLQCLDTCTIFCALEPGVCPRGMICEHGYCLLRCNGNDEDCASWPGFTCEHEGTACENYEPAESTGTGGATGTTGT